MKMSTKTTQTRNIHESGLLWLANSQSHADSNGLSVDAFLRAPSNHRQHKEPSPLTTTQERPTDIEKLDPF